LPLADALLQAKIALEISSRLSSEYPSVTDFQRVRALACSNAGKLYWLDGRQQDARQALEQARVIWQMLCDSNPEVPAQRIWVARMHSAVANLDLDAGHVKEALPGYQRALDILEELERTSNSGWTRAYLAITLRWVGLAEMAAGRRDKAAAAIRKA